MIEAMRLKFTASRFHTKFHENLRSGSEVISECTDRQTQGHTGRQTADLLSLLQFLESRLKMCLLINLHLISISENTS
jgi:hypothetical protein